jgi:AAA domain
MTMPGLRLRHLSFHGPNREAAAVNFGPGLNVIYGASETGKSFIAEAVDFMLGGQTPLRTIEQRDGYDRILLAAETVDGEQFTLQRSCDGGAFRMVPGLHIAPPVEGEEDRILFDQHNEKSPDNLSSFLLERCGMAGKRVRRNKLGATNSLSFRNIARLVLVTEDEIILQRSPLKDGNPTADTANFATFKLMLSGVDDSALITAKPKGPEHLTREAQLEMLDQILDEHRKRLRELTKNPEELQEQLQKLDNTLSLQQTNLVTTEASYRTLADRRREVRKKVEEGRDRRSEITELLERFNLLKRHYISDISRLRGIEEGGTLFEILGQSACPLCGADAEHHRKGGDCDGNVDAVVAAARSEIAKIELLQNELNETVAGLIREGSSFDKKLPKMMIVLQGISSEVDQLIAPKLAQLRTSYAGLADKRGEVREALAVLKTIQDIEERRSKADNNPDDPVGSGSADGDLSTTIADNFSKQVERILSAWSFPGGDRVHFDPKSRDLVIAGKARGARGKGLRAITHAAFTIGLLDFCKDNETPHPGFVLLDSPLLSYRAPEGSEDDLRETDLDARFYSYLAALKDDRQVIIIENLTPPDAIRVRPNVEMFSGSLSSGRYGLFPPLATKQSDLPADEISRQPGSEITE